MPSSAVQDKLNQLNPLLLSIEQCAADLGPLCLRRGGMGYSRRIQETLTTASLVRVRQVAAYCRSFTSSSAEKVGNAALGFDRSAQDQMTNLQHIQAADGLVSVGLCRMSSTVYAGSGPL